MSNTIAAASSRLLGDRPPPEGLRRVEAKFGLAVGLLFLALLAVHYLISGILPPTRFPTPYDTDEVIKQFFIDNARTIQVLSAVDMVAALALVVFVGFFIGWLRRKREASGWSILSSIALAGGVVASAFAGFSAIGLWVLSQSNSADSAAFFRVLHGLVYQAGGPALVLFVGVFMGASALAQRTEPSVPRWVTWTALVGAAVSVAAIPAMYWQPVTWVLPASRFFLGAWIFAICLILSRAAFSTRSDANLPAI